MPLLLLNVKYGSMEGIKPWPCADPEIFMRGGPTKMVIFGHRRGGVQPQKNPEITFFLGKIFKFQGGVRSPGPPLWIRA